MDALLLTCRDVFQLGEPSEKRLRLKSSSEPSATTSKRYFAPPKTEEEICKAKLNAVPATTAADTK